MYKGQREIETVISKVSVSENRRRDDVGQQFRCVRASLEALSVRGSGRGRQHRSPPGVLLQVRLTEEARNRRPERRQHQRRQFHEHPAVCSFNSVPLSFVPADFSSRWCPRHPRPVPEEVNPRRSMLDRTCRRSSVCWVSLCAAYGGMCHADTRVWM